MKVIKEYYLNEIRTIEQKFYSNIFLKMSSIM